MVAHSPTYVFFYEYVMDPHGTGAYDNMPLDAADRLLNTFPLALDGQFSHELFSHLASLEPNCYLALAQAGFPVLDSRDPSVDVQPSAAAVTTLISAALNLLPKVSVLDVDAVIWCTGFAGKNVRPTAPEVFGVSEPDLTDNSGVLGPKDIAARLDASRGVDAEGEVLGIWKRHLRMDNYWLIGGVMQYQRWWSRSMAQLIKLALQECLPPAYRDTPEDK
ncbi:hypothetical protein Hte_010947 [Hypoxylon texense]